MDRIDDILFLYEDDTVEMADGGPITANKIPLKPANRNINKKGQPDTTRVEMVAGGILKGLKLAGKLKDYVKKYKDKNKNIPSIMKVREDTSASTKSIKKYLDKDKDYTSMTKAEAAKLGGQKTGAARKSDVTEISPKLKDKIDNLKLRGLSARLEPSKAGGKFIRLRATSKPLRDALGKKSRGDNLFSGPATEQNYKTVKKMMGEIKNSKAYEKTIKPFQGSEQKRAIRRGRAALLKKGDPQQIYKKMQQMRTAAGSTKGQSEIHHGRFKGFGQRPDVMAIVDTRLNNLKSLKDAESARNLLIREQKRILNPKTKLPLAAKQRKLEMINARLNRLKKSLRGTKAAGLMDVRMVSLDDAGKQIIKDRGFDISKGIGFRTKEGATDLATLEKENAKQLLEKIKPLLIDIEPLPAFAGGGYLAGGLKKLGRKYKGSTLEAILENPKLVGTELGYEGLSEIMNLLQGSGLFADGGIASLPGVKSGPPPESGPNPQGLENLKYYVTNT